jgi:hypothetical protein
MIENIRSVGNPLTVIAIFAGLAEVASTVVLAFLPPNLQETFLWFVMGFPTALVIAFFATLNFNRGALYAPGDFKDEENFVRSLERRAQVRGTFDEVSIGIEQTKIEASELSGEHSFHEQREIIAKLTAQITDLEKKFSNATEATDALVSDAAPIVRRTVSREVMRYLAEADGEKTSRDIAEALRIPNYAVSAVLQRMASSGFIDGKIESRAGSRGRPRALYTLTETGRVAADIDRRENQDVEL